jgi:alkyldihydroxyacetonephosphate synthase
MRRWNGWGKEDTNYPLPPIALQYLQNLLGEGFQKPDVPMDAIMAGMPASRLWDNASITTNPETRLRHARGQSLPDWIALRSGRVGGFPDGVAFPASEQEIRDIFSFASESDIQIIPYGGGTSVVGHVNPIPAEKPILTVNLGRLGQLHQLDTTSQLATLGAGICGPDLEATLNRQGYTLGHFPQSHELSTLGGWIATRSSGQQSYYYGRIEDLFAGGHVETPQGPLQLPSLPASAAGPDLRQVILGSEGRMGILTQATVRIRPLPEMEHFYGVFFKDWDAGVAALREAAQEEISLSMMRLSDPLETQTTLILSGRERLVELSDRGLNLIGYGQGRCLLIYGVTGDRQDVPRARSRANAIFRSHGGLPAISMIGGMWNKSRFLSPYLRNTLWDLGYAIDTLETAVPWSSVPNAHMDITSALQKTASEMERPLHVFAHLSHVYRDGASIYVTFIFPREPDPDSLLHYWQALKSSASQVILEVGGTISHQHGVGLDHAPYLPREKGTLGIQALDALCKQFDPEGILNPGKLIKDSMQMTTRG